MIKMEKTNDQEKLKPFQLYKPTSGRRINVKKKNKRTSNMVTFDVQVLTNVNCWKIFDKSYDENCLGFLQRE